MNVKEYIKKNWKSITFVLAIAFLILLNVRTYRQSASIYKENQKINIEYAELLKREDLHNQQIGKYKSEIDKKNAEIVTSKEKITETESLLDISQSETKRLSKIILGKKVIAPEDFKEYTEVCDSLAVIAPLLSDQVDTLKNQNKKLINTLEQKSIIQDSIIKEKNQIIFSKGDFLVKTVDSYNKSVEKLQVVENKLDKEKKRKGFWKKVAIGLAVGVTGIIAIK